MGTAPLIGYFNPRRADSPGDFALSDLSERLRFASETAFGGSSKRLARALDVNQRRAQHWLAGDDEPPVAVVEQVEAIAQALNDTNANTEIADLILSWRRAGIHEEAIASVLADAYAELTKRTIS